MRCLIPSKRPRSRGQIVVIFALVDHRVHRPVRDRHRRLLVLGEQPAHAARRRRGRARRRRPAARPTRRAPSRSAQGRGEEERLRRTASTVSSSTADQDPINHRRLQVTRQRRRRHVLRARARHQLVPHVAHVEGRVRPAGADGQSRRTTTASSAWSGIARRRRPQPGPPARPSTGTRPTTTSTPRPSGPRTRAGSTPARPRRHRRRRPGATPATSTPSNDSRASTTTNNAAQRLGQLRDHVPRHRQLHRRDRGQRRGAASTARRRGTTCPLQCRPVLEQRRHLHDRRRHRSQDHARP